MKRTTILGTLVVISIIGDALAKLSELGPHFALAITQGTLGVALFASIYNDWRKEE